MLPEDHIDQTQTEGEVLSGESACVTNTCSNFKWAADKKKLDLNQIESKQLRKSTKKTCRLKKII